MKINRNRYLILLLALFMLINIPMTAMADSNIEIDYKQDGSDLTVSVKGERNRPVSISIKDASKYYFLDQSRTNESGMASFKTKLDVDKAYKSKVNIDGKVAEKDIIMKAISQPDPDKDPDKDRENTASIYIKGYKGLILNKSRVEIRSGENALEFTERVLNDNNIAYKIRSGYMSEIDGQREFDKGSDSGWMFSINGKYPDIGASSIKVRSGDDISWTYTHDLGEDIGAPSWKPNDQDLDIENPIIEEGLKTIEDKSASESDIEKAMDSMVKYFTDKKSNLQAKEIEKILKEAKGASKTLLLAMDRVKTEKLAINIANNAIEITNALDRILADNNDLGITKDLAEISRENMAIALNSTYKIKNRAEIESIIDDIVKTSVKVEARLSNINLKPNKTVEKSIGINVIGEKNTSGDFILPKSLIEKSIKENLNNIKIFSDLLSMEIDPYFLGKDIKEDVKISFKITQNYSSIELKQGDKIVKELQRPIKIILPYSEKVENQDNITVSIILEDGTEELLGGIYDSKNRAVKFSTYKLAKFKITEKPVSFDDISGHKWAKKSIDTMAAKGIIYGRGEKQFDPAASITRAEFSATIARILKLNETIRKDLPFKDLSKDKWYYKSVATMYENGLVSGRNKDIFDPQGNITRQEMTRIIGQILQNNLYKKQDEKTLNVFDDVNAISNWARQGVAMSASNKVIVGDKGKFMPHKYATRAELAVVLSKLYELILD